MKILFLRPAEVELKNAIDYYNRQRAGLGYGFAAEKRTVRRIKAHPEAWYQLSENTRRCRLNRFPYSIVYAFTETELTVLAVMHLESSPSSGKKDERSPNAG